MHTRLVCELLLPRAMNGKHVYRTLRGGAVCLALSAAVFASSAVAQQTPAPPGPNPDLLPTGQMPLSPNAEAFRTHVGLLLQEHTYLAGATTEALIMGRREECLANQAMLNANTVELSRVIGALYGPANEAQFFQGWKRHIQDYELYAQGAMTGSAAQKQQARADLDAYVAEAQTFLQSLNPNAPTGRLGSALADHVHGTLDVIDAQAAKDVTRAYTLGRAGATMTANMLGDPLALSIIQEFPERFPGDPNATDAGFRRQTALLVQADTILGGAVLSNTVMGRTPEANAISGVLEQNTTDLTNLVGGRLGDSTEFASFWRNRQNALMTYAQAVPANDNGGRQQAVAQLSGFGQNIDQLFTPVGGSVLSERFVPQDTYVTSALDALGAHDVGTAKAFLGGASKQSEEIGIRLALAAAMAATAAQAR
ncbi:MAG: hypothetical protein JOY61_19750 [Chloroflexi bacterium]|nr:hypothetical protein [Chloroflexota bacterium]